MWQVGLAALILERISKTRGREWTSIFSGKERQMARGRGINGGREIRVKGNINPHRTSMLVLGGQYFLSSIGDGLDGGDAVFSGVLAFNSNTYDIPSIFFGLTVHRCYCPKYI